MSPLERCNELNLSHLFVLVFRTVHVSLSEIVKHKTGYKKSVFSHVARNNSNLLEQKKEFIEEKSSTPVRLVWNTNMAAFLCSGTPTWRT